MFFATAAAPRALGVTVDRECDRDGQGRPQCFSDSIALRPGAVEAALRWCVRAYETRDFLCVMLPIDGMFRLVLPGETTALVDDPRWIDLVKRVGMT